MIWSGALVHLWTVVYLILIVWTFRTQLKVWVVYLAYSWVFSPRRTFTLTSASLELSFCWKLCSICLPCWQLPIDKLADASWHLWWMFREGKRNLNITEDITQEGLEKKQLSTWSNVAEWSMRLWNEKSYNTYYLLSL